VTVRAPDVAQAGLFDAPTTPRARARDPETSQTAAQGARAAAAAHRARILAWLEAQGPVGGTYTEIAAGVFLEPVQVDRRLVDLRRTGHLVRLSTTRRTPSGCPAHVHVARQFVGSDSPNALNERLPNV